MATVGAKRGVAESEAENNEPSGGMEAVENHKLQRISGEGRGSREPLAPHNQPSLQQPGSMDEACHRDEQKYVPPNPPLVPPALPVAVVLSPFGSLATPERLLASIAFLTACHGAIFQQG